MTEITRKTPIITRRKKTNTNGNNKDEFKEDRPKRPMSSFMVFYQAHYRQMLEFRPDKLNEISKVMGVIWNNLSKENQAPYIARARLDTRRYEKDMCLFVEKHRDNPKFPIDKHQKYVHVNTDHDTESNAFQNNFLPNAIDEKDLKFGFDNSMPTTEETPTESKKRELKVSTESPLQKNKQKRVFRTFESKKFEEEEETFQVPTTNKIEAKSKTSPDSKNTKQNNDIAENRRRQSLEFSAEIQTILVSTESMEDLSRVGKREVNFITTDFHLEKTCSHPEDETCGFCN